MKFIPIRQDHFPLLLKWLKAPHVKAFWDPNIQWTKELITEKYSTYIEGYKLENGIKKLIYAFIIYLDDLPIGYIQFYNAYDFEREYNIKLENLPTSLATLDIFIGEEQFIGNGLGTIVINKFLKKFILKKFKACFVDVEAVNTLAVKAYKNNGFKVINNLQDGKILRMLKHKT
ncbi:GNAT family N-acetyltransferase [Rickettsiales endosymbiont of Stachyamoeba lipophora]|nr:GNAT family N-acetyltransferase [Rickettsiales endosymbiont of Stachyamoeba lipophora]